MNVTPRVGILAGGLILLYASFKAPGQEMVVPALKISLAKETFVVGEPIIVSVMLQNESAEQIKGLWPSNDSFRRGADFLFAICSPDQTVVSKLPKRSEDRTVYWRAALKPGECLRCEEIVPSVHWPGGERRSFPYMVGILPEGMYEMQARLYWSSAGEPGYISSNSVAFTIAAAEGADAEALPLLAFSDVHLFLVDGIRRETRRVQELLQFIDSHADSTYTKYVRLQTILNRLAAYEDKSPMDLTDSEREGIRGILEKAFDFVSTYPDIPVNDNILLACAYLQDNLRDERSAAETLERIMSAYPDGDARPEAEQYLARVREMLTRHPRL